MFAWPVVFIFYIWNVYSRQFSYASRRWFGYAKADAQEDEEEEGDEVNFELNSKPMSVIITDLPEESVLEPPIILHFSHSQVNQSIFYCYVHLCYNNNY